ncbi:MAG: PKD domain-containing protein [Thaumarchaeota archaeon]|nr:PKD domain-containing protein [Nitrososphaerota archaeon]
MKNSKTVLLVASVAVLLLLSFGLPAFAAGGQGGSGGTGSGGSGGSGGTGGTGGSGGSNMASGGCPGLSGAPEQVAIPSELLSLGTSDSGNVRTYNIVTSGADGAFVSGLCIYPEGGVAGSSPTAIADGWAAASTSVGAIHFAATMEGNGINMTGSTVAVGKISWTSTVIPADSMVLAKITWPTECAVLYPPTTTTETSGGSGGSGQGGSPSGEEEAGSCLVALVMTVGAQTGQGGSGGSGGSGGTGGSGGSGGTGGSGGPGTNPAAGGCPGASGAPEQIAIPSELMSYTVKGGGNDRTYYVNNAAQNQTIETAAVTGLCVYPTGGIDSSVPEAYPSTWTAATTSVGALHFVGLMEAGALPLNGTSMRIGTVSWPTSTVPDDMAVLAKITWASECATLYPVTETTTTESTEEAGTCLVLLSPQGQTSSLTITETTVSSALIATGQSASFSVSASGGSEPYSYHWNFGDTGSSNSKNPNHSYTETGTYPVVIEVTDSSGATVSQTLTVTVVTPTVSTGGPVNNDHNKPVGSNLTYPYGLTASFSGSSLVAITGAGTCNIQTGTIGVCEVIPFNWTATLVDAQTAASHHNLGSSGHLQTVYSTNIPLSALPNGTVGIWFIDSNGNMTPLSSIISEPSMPYLNFPAGIYGNYGWYPPTSLAGQ